MVNPADQTNIVMIILYSALACSNCGTRLRFGDFECPHCGKDSEYEFRALADIIVNRINAT